MFARATVDALLPTNVNVIPCMVETFVVYPCAMIFLPQIQVFVLVMVLANRPTNAPVKVAFLVTSASNLPVLAKALWTPRFAMVEVAALLQIVVNVLKIGVVPNAKFQCALIILPMIHLFAPRMEIAPSQAPAFVMMVGPALVVMLLFVIANMDSAWRHILAVVTMVGPVKIAMCPNATRLLQIIPQFVRAMVNAHCPIFVNAKQANILVNIVILQFASTYPPTIVLLAPPQETAQNQILAFAILVILETNAKYPFVLVLKDPVHWLVWDEALVERIICANVNKDTRANVVKFKSAMDLLPMKPRLAVDMASA